ncbi:MAG: biotin/lipoyl-binding protein, partial [Exilibacterium sp.]
MWKSLKCGWALAREAWDSRHQWGEADKDYQTLAFLPAALEIQEKPPSPAGRILGWSLMVLVTLAIAWACVGRVNIVAVAEGKIVPGGRVKQIQPLEKGVVKTIYVTEGQAVEQGDPLIELDQTLTRADQQRLLNELHFTRLAFARQQALVKLLSQKPGTTATVSLPLDQLPITWIEPLSEGEQRQQRLLLWQVWREHQSRLGALLSQEHHREAERRAGEAIIEKLEFTLPIITRRAEAVTTRAEKTLSPHHELLKLEQPRIETQPDLKAERARQEQLSAAIEEVQHQIASLKAELSSRTLNEIEESERQFAALTQELNKARELNAK